MPSPAAADAVRRLTGWAIAALALITGVLGILVMLAPVNADDPVVSWPRAGQQPTSTVLPLSPYRPLQLTATIPCATLQALDARPDGGTALRTLPADVGATPGEGLTVSTASGVVTVTASGSEVMRQPLPAGDCIYQVIADAGGVRVSRDGAASGARTDLLVPQVAELTTDAVTRTSGLSVQLHTDARYQSYPTALKTVLLIGHGLALVALLVLAWWWWRGEGAGLVRPRLSWADAVVVATSLAWVVLGPLNIDDSWYLLMARNAMESGYIGNVIYQFNVTENPFVASQYAMQAWGALGDNWSLAWMRLLPLAYGLATYALLRVLVATVLGRVALRRPGPGRFNTVPWAVAAAHLLWWLPYGITLRPEPLIALGTAGTFVLAELARRRRSMGVFATATALAALTVTASPTGIVAAAPLVLCLPWLWQWWRERRQAADRLSRLTAALLVSAAPSIVIPVAFADATLGDLLESVAVHRWYYRQNAWYEEYLHYANLLVGDDRGAWGKRLPVLLTLAVLLAAALGAGRRAGTAGPSGRLLSTAAVVTAAGLVAIAFTPTKWVNHFGAVAAPATVLLAAAVIRSPLPRRIGTTALAIGTGGLVVAVSVAFAGPNLWRPFSDWGQPFGHHVLVETPYSQSLLAPSVGPLALRNPLLWLAIAAAGWWWARRRGWPSPDRAVLVTATGLGVALMLTVFTIAPLRQYPGTSVALMNLRALTGQPCGLASSMQVLTGLGPPRGVTDVIAGRPVFADQVSAGLWPCQDQIAIQNGLAQPPALRLRAGDGLEESILYNSTFADNGGTLLQIDRSTKVVELPARLTPPGVPTLSWGHVDELVYDHPVGLVDLHVTTVRRAGWTRLPTLIGQRYTGRAYIG
ncbi:MAG: arabinosyltransferase domain-containing protein [Pseudonocardiaceae bacterium]